MIDPNDQTWAAVKAHTEGRLRDAVSALKNPNVDFAETQRLRGRIEELEGVLALVPVEKKTDTALPADPPQY